jgi:glycosyltransferase involved in cell wall biosynthesis
MSRVLAITNNLEQASFRLRLAAISEPLRQRGVELDIQVRPRGILARRRLLRSAANYDAVLLQRKMLDPFDMKLLRRSSRKLFYDVDDAVMYFNRPIGPIRRWQNWRRFLATARGVDLVVAGNKHLAEIFSSHGAKSLVLPSVVDTARYPTKIHSATDAPKLVWIGSKSTLPYVRQILPIIGDAAKVIPGLGLIIIADQTISDAPVPVTFIPWSEETEAAALIQGDIGIAPTPEDRWTLGKCGLKIVQYMAAGLPVIASPVGANKDIVLAGQTGLLPENPQQWLAAITQLCGDLELRRRWGAAGRQRAEESYSLARAADFWATLLK